MTRPLSFTQARRNGFKVGWDIPIWWDYSAPSPRWNRVKVAALRWLGRIKLHSMTRPLSLTQAQRWLGTWDIPLVGLR